MKRLLAGLLLALLSAPAYAQVGQYPEDSAHVSGHFMTPILCVRRDTPTSLVGADNDYIPCTTDSAGRIHMAGLVTNAGTFAVQAAQSGTWTVGLTAGGDVDILTVPAPLSTTGGGTEATALRVTVANDSTGVLSVDDNGGALTVDGTVTVTDGAGALNVIVDSGAITATVTDGAGALNVIVDSGTVTTVTTLTGTTSLTPGVAAGNLGKAEDAAAASADTGVMVLMQRQDTPASTTGADGDYSTLRGTDTGRLYTSTTVDAALPAGDNNIGNVDVVTMPTVTVTDGAGAMNVIIDSSATLTVTDGAGALNTIVDSGTITTVTTLTGTTTLTPGTAAANLGKAEDAAHSSSDVGVMGLAVRLDSAASFAGTDGDYAPLQLDSAGALRVTGGGGGTEYVEDAVAPADPTGTTTVMTRDDQLATVTEAEGDWSRLRGTSKGALWVALADSSGDPITSFGGGTQYTEDAAAAANPVGTALNLVRADALAGLTTTDGDNVAARGTDKGELYVKHADTMIVGDGSGALNVIADSGTITTVTTLTGTTTLTPGTAAGNLGKAEDAAHASADTLVAVGVRRIDTPLSSAGTSGDYATLDTDSLGQLWTTKAPRTTVTATVLDSDGAQTGTSVATISTGTTIWVEAVTAIASSANTVAINVRVMCDTDGTFAAAATTGTAGELLSAAALIPGQQVSTPAGFAHHCSDDQDLRYTVADPVGGDVRLTFTYYTTAP